MQCKILRLFVNTLTADDKYSLLNRDNLTQRVQILLIQKQKTFSEFFSAFLKATLNFEHFAKKDDPNRRCISEITDSEKGDYINVPNVQFQTTLPQATWQTCPKAVAIIRAAPLPYLLITVNIIQLKKVCFSSMQYLNTVC